MNNIIKNFFSEKEIKLFLEIIKEEDEYYNNLLKGIFKKDYPFGFIHGKLEEKDEKITILISKISQLFSNKKFKEYIVCLEKNKVISEIMILKDKLKNNPKDRLKKYNLKNNEKYLQELNKKAFKAFKEFYRQTYLSFNDKKIFSFSCKEYIALKVCELLIEEIESIDKSYQFEFNNELEKFYLEHNINLQNDIQYKKYGLISITPEMEIKISNIPKIYDKRVKEYIWLNVKEEILKIIEKLRSLNLIKDLALRPFCEIKKDLGDVSIALEEMVRGKKFTLNIKELPSITQLYNIDYDNLWIKKDDKNIIFEEVLNIDEDLLKCKEYVVTQVLHLQYFEKNSKYFISHLDHEYIFYSKEEFKKRISNPDIKGKKFKTFKIDNSNIPIIVNSENILYKFLEYLFINVELLNEYFENVKR